MNSGFPAAFCLGCFFSLFFPLSSLPFPLLLPLWHGKAFQKMTLQLTRLEGHPGTP